MVETLHACPICQATESDKYLTCEDYTVTHETFQIVQCAQCGFKFTNPRPTQDAIGRFYQSSSYISHSNTSKGLINRFYQIARRFTLQQKLKLVNQLHATGALLDVGCGTGEFLKVCKKNGWSVKGIEQDPQARQVAQQNSQSEIQSNLLEAYPNEQFHVITLWHVLEHMHELQASMQRLKSMLTKDGALVIAVPNSDSLDAQLYKEYWAAYDVPRHLYHFNQKDMTTLVQKNGLKIARVRPMKLDAFYISLLSTKYRDGITNYSESIRTGIKSNEWAARNMNNYSSLAYIINQ